MNLIANLILVLLLWAGGYAVYLSCNHGLAPNARLQQLFRYLMASIVAVVPLAVTLSSPIQAAVVLPLLVSIAWMVTYPLSYHLTHRRSSPDYDNQMDVAFGIYLFGWLSGLMLLLADWGVVGGLTVGLLMVVLLFVPITLCVYHVVCHHVLDANGMKMLQETHYNEIIEFLRSYSLLRVLAVALMMVLLATGCIYAPIRWPLMPATSSWWQLAVAGGMVVFMTVYMWKPKHGLFVRTGIAQLYLIVKEYVANNNRYIDEQQVRLSTLDASATTPLCPQPHTLLMVIGESASRDFMSAFTPMDVETTPWLSQMKADRQHCILFPHAYSCDIQTVPTLEKALTEYNQYDAGKQFYTSCSIVDMAHKLGYRVHWYSNQGHLGAADTPITLVANTADVAKWTHQQLNRVQYDESLLDFLDEVDPTKNNLVVLHLKGSHFNYENRFPPQYRQWGTTGNHDKITNYKNTLYYTDSVLRRAYSYMRERLNMQAMVYCSDHADVPDRHRQPNFGGFRDVRIPLMVWLGDEYLAARPHRVQALMQNRDCYWTNDLLYELMCGLMDAQSNHFCEENSLASPRYRFTRDMLTAMNGTIRIAEDEYDKGVRRVDTSR